MRNFDKTRDWVCPYCGVIAFEGQNKLRHLAKHEPTIRRMLRQNLILTFEAIARLEV